jgi:hypothetical protein
MAGIRAIPTPDEVEMSKKITDTLLRNWLPCTTCTDRYKKVQNIVLNSILVHNRQLPDENKGWKEEEW